VPPSTGERVTLRSRISPGDGHLHLEGPRRRRDRAQGGPAAAPLRDGPFLQDRPPDPHGEPPAAATGGGIVGRLHLEGRRSRHPYRAGDEIPGVAPPRDVGVLRLAGAVVETPGAGRGGHAVGQSRARRPDALRSPHRPGASRRGRPDALYAPGPRIRATPAAPELGALRPAPASIRVRSLAD